MNAKRKAQQGSHLIVDSVEHLFDHLLRETENLDIDVVDKCLPNGDVVQTECKAHTSEQSSPIHFEHDRINKADRFYKFLNKEVLKEFFLCKNLLQIDDRSQKCFQTEMIQDQHGSNHK